MDIGTLFGIPLASKLRKDEIEELIKQFLRTGEVKGTTRQSLSRSGIRDIDKGLDLRLPVVNYTSKKETKDSIIKEALRIAPKGTTYDGA